MLTINESIYDKLGTVFIQYLEYKVKNNKDKDDEYGLYIEIFKGTNYYNIAKKYKWTIVRLKKEINYYCEKGEFIWD